jgi:hypothetical protein
MAVVVSSPVDLVEVDGWEGPPDPTAVGLISNLFSSQSFVVMSCCSGLASMIIDIQFRLLTVGITTRVWSVLAPTFIN